MKIEKILDMVLAELARAEKIHPHWPGHDLVHAAGIVSEESGELIRAALRNRYAEGGTVADVRTEAVHTATTAIRLLLNLEEEEEMKRGSTLVEALEIINGERQDVYGNPEDSFALIAEYWSTYLDHHIQATDVAVMMVFFKMAREKNQHKRDNLVDAAGYLGILGDMYDEDGQN